MTEGQFNRLNTGLGVLALLLFGLFGLGILLVDKRLTAIEAALGIVR